MKRLLMGIFLAVALLIAGWLVLPRLVEMGYLVLRTLDASQAQPGDEAITPENAAQLTLIERRGWGSINDVAWSPDSRSLALATTTGIRLVEAGSLNLLGEYPTEGRVKAVAFLADGSRLAGAVEGKGVAIWRLGSPAVEKLLEVPGAGWSDWMFGLQFSGDGRWVAVTWRRVLYAWDVQTGFRRVQIHPQEPDLSIPWLVSFLPGQGRLLYADEARLYMRDVETGVTEVVAPLAHQSNSAWAVDAAGTRMALGGCGQLNLFEVGQDTPHAILLPDDTCIKQVVFSVDGDGLQRWQLAALTAAGSLYLIDKDGAVLPLEPGGQPNNATWGIPMRFSPDGQTLAWVAAPWALHLYRTEDGSLVQPLRSPWAAIQAVHLENMDEGLVILDEGDQVSLASITLEERLASWEGDTSCRLSNFQRAGFSADGSMAWLRQCSGCTVRETEPGATTGARGSLYGAALPCGEITALSPTGDRLAVAYRTASSGDPSWVLVYRTRSGLLAHRYNIQNYMFRSLQFSPDGQLLLAVGNDGETFLWAGGLRVFPWISGLGWYSVFTPDGLGLASGSGVVSLSTRAVSSLPRGQQSQVAVSPDGRLMARRGQDGTIELWDVVQVKLLRRLYDLPGFAALMTFSADGSRLLVVQDGVMAFWGVK